MAEDSMNAILRASVVVVSCLIWCSALCAQSEIHHYGLRYDLTLKPAEERAEVSLTLDERAKDNIWSMRFHIDPARHEEFVGDGTIEAEGDYVTWKPPAEGGKLSFHVPVSNLRPNGRFDARMTDNWALFRGDDLFPAASTEQHDHAEAEASLHVHLPEGWSFVAPYPAIKAQVFGIEHADRSFDRPTGWMAAGHLGVRRERIAGVRVIVAGPMHEGVRRLDMLALLNWNLPELHRLVPDMPKRILVVSAGDPMWRGGLSGPNSLFVHADRPLLSENGSSPLVHEMVHVATGIVGEKGGDWIVEGIAEYYSLKLMWRSGTLTDHRYKQSFLKLSKWAKQAGRLDVDASRGPTTARAVGIIRELDHEIHKNTDQMKSLDDVVRLLVAAKQKVTIDRLRKAVIEVMGEPAKTLSDGELRLESEGK
jgi:hypothetical protein